MKLEEVLKEHGMAKRRPYESDPTYWLIVGSWTYLSNLRLEDFYADDWEPA